MRRMLLPACLLLAATPFSAAAVEACDVPPRFGLSPLAIAIRNTACNEHRLWFRPFIDRDGRAASLSVTEAEGDHLADNGLIAWQRVTSYWRESSTLNALGSQPGASSCLAPLGTRYTDSDCRAFLIDNPWSAAFISWVMVRAGVPGFTTSPRHIDYIRAAYQAGPSGVPYRLVDPATAKPAPGDLLCFLRDRSSTLSYSGLVQALGNGSVGHWKSHCEVVVAANLGGDQTLYLVGGNVMNTVAMRLLQLDRTGTIKLPPPRERDATGIDPTCTPGREDECSFNRQDWAALLQLNATAPRLAPVPSAVPTTPTQMPPQPATEPGSNR
ncbi:DUF2272 domain-containing protein [Stenotrophomonas lactitubi]|uniref:DUF2272 domain-containing protein n=1 Tax=Stenotrophomonas lactitubi TaxID=2045214 RepID=UPI002248AF07|nr:DUF2272 domain-containing protein [Stenotrophomonas lactitubi]MCX2893296.1 DUF2272 domain-containing protein [Stenotrophomonas lactitubi]